MTLHVAGPADLDVATLYALLRLRVDVFVVEQRCPYPELDDRDLAVGTRHLWLAGPDGPLPPRAYLRLLTDADGTARIGRVCTAAAERGAGLSGRLMEAALRMVGAAPVVLDAQEYVAAFYARYGFVATGPSYIDDGIAHVPMRRPGAGDSP